MINIFKKHSSRAQKDMSSEQFVGALDDVADLYFNELYDE